MTLGMLAVLFIPVLPYLPALMVLAVAVVAGNWREFKLSREEKISTAIVGVLLAVSLPVVWYALKPAPAPPAGDSYASRRDFTGCRVWPLQVRYLEGYWKLSLMPPGIPTWRHKYPYSSSSP